MTTPTEAATRKQRRDTERDAALIALALAATHQLSGAWTILGGARDHVLTELDAMAAETAATRATPTRARRALTVLREATARFDRDAMGIAARWAAVDLPIAYRNGAQQALKRARAAATLFTWTATHQATLTALTATAYAALVARIQEAVRRAQAFGRAAAAAAREPLGPDTKALAEQHPLDTVIYGDASRHPAAAWARSALLAQATTAANTGALRAAADELDCDWMEIADGPECGWVSHPDTDMAHGTIRSIDACAAYPSAHPGCIRELIPRPDLTGRDDIEDGQSA